MTRGQEWSGAATDAPHTHRTTRPAGRHTYTYTTHTTHEILHTRNAPHTSGRPQVAHKRLVARAGARGDSRLLTLSHSQYPTVHPPAVTQYPSLSAPTCVFVSAQAQAAVSLMWHAQPRARNPSRAAPLSSPVSPSSPAHFAAAGPCTKERSRAWCRVSPSVAHSARSRSLVLARSPRFSTCRRRRSSLQVDVVDVAVVAVGVGVLSTCRRRRCRWRP